MFSDFTAFIVSQEKLTADVLCFIDIKKNTIINNIGKIHLHIMNKIEYMSTGMGRLAQMIKLKACFLSRPLLPVVLGFVLDTVYSKFMIYIF